VIKFKKKGRKITSGHVIERGDENSENKEKKERKRENERERKRTSGHVVERGDGAVCEIFRECGDVTRNESDHVTLTQDRDDLFALEWKRREKMSLGKRK